MTNTVSNIFVPLYSTGSGVIPLASELVTGELGVNLADGRLFVKDHNGNVVYLLGQDAVSASSADTSSYAATSSVSVTSSFAAIACGSIDGPFMINGPHIANTLSTSSTNALPKITIDLNVYSEVWYQYSAPSFTTLSVTFSGGDTGSYCHAAFKNIGSTNTVRVEYYNMYPSFSNNTLGFAQGSASYTAVQVFYNGTQYIH